MKHGDDDSVTGMRAFLDAVSADPPLEATALQTMGIKGWDDFLLARAK